MNEIASQTNKLYNGIRSRFKAKIVLLQNELKEKEILRSSYYKEKDFLYVILLTIQVIGIALTILGESRTNNKTG